MKLELTEDRALPRLAWLLQRDEKAWIRVRHGEWVESLPNGFVEGVWNGSFAVADFTQTDCFFGTGGMCRDGKFIVVSSASTNDFCYYAERGGSFWVSNSMCLLLASMGDALDPANERYIEINNSVLKGVRRYQEKIPTLQGEIHRLMYRNLELSSDGLCLIDKPMAPQFCEFADYKRYLSENYGLIAKNARDTARRRIIRLASTQSKGYDTTAINAIAAPHGLDIVFSIAKGKGHGKFADQDEADEVDDSGGEIGEVLGFVCTYIDRRAIQKDSTNEHLYYASLHASEDTNFAGMDAHIKEPTAVLIGPLGEITSPWRYYYNYYGRSEAGIEDMERADHGGNGLGEVRLRSGFITLPFFYMGARRRREIMDICDSADMDPWRLNNNYDRPMARRMAEEGGVPRELFGQKKYATAMVFTPPILPFNDALREEYIAFLDRERLQARWKWKLLPLVRKINQFIWFSSPRQNLAMYYLQRVIGKLTNRPGFLFKIIWKRLDVAFYVFCVNKRVAEYRSGTAGTPMADGS